MNFDFFSCIQHNVIVDERNAGEHENCDKVGEFFKVKVNKPKLSSGLISKRLINAAKEEQNIKKFKAKEKLRKHKKVLAQERFEKQIPDNDVIINLTEMKI